MKRLQVRLTLAFMGVVFLVAIIPFLISFVYSRFNLPNNEVLAFLAGLSSNNLDQLRVVIERAILIQLLQYSLSAIIAGIIAGIVVSRTLTAPLNELVAGAKAIGKRDLSYRVALDESSSEELVAVASAFNEMATELEKAQSRRQNLLADVAHELRTPLTVIQGNLRALLDEVYPLTSEEVDRLYDQTRHLTKLVEDLHELSEAEAQQLSLNKTRVDLVTLVKQVGEAFRPIAEAESLQLRIELLGKIPHLEADQARLTQSLHNLLSNALQHTPMDGMITLQVEYVEPEVQLRVMDTGAGIAPEHLPYVFDRFYRIDKARARHKGGTGLGLAIVRAIAKAHGGRVEVKSAGMEQGSTFIIHLPLSSVT